ncbi:MAG: glucosidase family protein [Candidatus Syntropharchaeia archaeon]
MILSLKKREVRSFREAGMLSFGIEWNGILFHDAGDFCFRTVWLRDEFEGLIWNMKTLLKHGEGSRVRDILLHAFSYQNDSGLLPNRMIERGGKLEYNSSDAVLLGFIAGERLLLQESHPVFVRDLHGRIDGRWSSAGVVAVSLLKELLFSKDYVVDFLHGVRERLLVRRDGKVFGVVVIEGERGYRSPRDYHRGVVWPRDTPYLIDLLRWIGDKETIKEILESNLSHQMEEGFLFYNAELFSPENDRLIPVKNPVQFWSQWTDPFLYI